MSDYDTVIVGGGLGGLTAGARLAKRGAKVLLLEQHYVPGGCATTFKRKDYLMEVGLHEIDGLDALDPKRQIFEFLGIDDCIEFRSVPDLFRKVSRGKDFVCPHGETASYDALCKAFPQEEKALQEFYQLMISLRQEVEKLPQKAWKNVLLFPVFPLLFPKTVKASSLTLGAYLDKYFNDEELKLLLVSNLTYYHDDPYTMSLMFFAVAQAGYIQGGGHFIKGGSQQLSNTLAEVIRANGGDILLGKSVSAINVDGNHVTGVTYCDSFNLSSPPVTVQAGTVVANAAVPLVADMLPEPHSSKLHAKIAPQEHSCSLLTVYIGFDTDLKTLGSTHYSTFVASDQVTSLRDFAGNCKAGFDERGFVFVDYGQIDSGLAPAGKTFGSICCPDYLSDWDGLDSEAYRAKKREVAETLLARLETLLPGMRETIEHFEVGTARTVRDYTLNPNGTVYGFAQIPNQAGDKRFSGYPSVKGLHFASAWAGPGGGFTGAILSGFRCAQDMRIKHAPKNLPSKHAFHDHRSVRFAGCRDICRDTFEIAFEKPDGFNAKPGQYAFVTLDSPKETALDVPVRPLSIVSCADEDVVRFAMRTSDSSFKKSCLAMGPEDTATLYGPTGDFLLPNTPKPIVFLTGGIGITPIIPMIRALEAQGFPKQVALFYSDKTPDSMAYREELEAIVHDRFTFHPVFTTTQKRIDDTRLKEHLGTPAAYQYYMVGTGNFLTTMQDILTRQGVPNAQITIDDFG